MNLDRASSPAPGPVAAGERIEIIDTLRGFALLGILVINIEFFGLPGSVYFDPRLAGGFAGVHLLAWEFSYVFFLQKMMGLFSVLFGAGVVLLTDRAREHAQTLRGTYYRRTLWLLVFGMIHGYLIWYGDILFTYAVVGLMLYLLRNRSPRTLVILAVGVLLFGSALQWGTGLSMATVRKEVTRIESEWSAGSEISARESRLLQQWALWEETFSPGPETVNTEVEAYRGGYLDNLRFRLPQNLMMQTQAMLFFVIWRAAGMMLLGMALLKWGVLSGRRSRRFYVWLTLVGYVGGGALCVLGLRGLMARDFDFVYRLIAGNQFNYWGSVLMVLAYAGTWNLIRARGWLPGLSRRLAAVGRMAFSNYIMHSLVCTTIFYGFGFGWFNRIDRAWLLLIVLALWIVQLYLSPWWLARYRFGPLEWLWRSLTYLKRQPWRLAGP